jgi:hypothetical protein
MYGMEQVFRCRCVGVLVTIRQRGLQACVFSARRRNAFEISGHCSSSQHHMPPSGIRDGRQTNQELLGRHLESRDDQLTAHGRCSICLIFLIISKVYPQPVRGFLGRVHTQAYLQRGPGKVPMATQSPMQHQYRRARRRARGEFVAYQASIGRVRRPTGDCAAAQANLPSWFPSEART